MVDPERLHRLLRRVTDDLSTLRSYRDVPPEELVGDPVRLGHLKYVFITALEGCIDAAHHVGAAEGYAPPGNNAEAMLLLARHDVVDAEVGQSLAEAVRFRNLLVHGYAEIDDRRVVANLQRLGDLEAFVAQVSRLL